MLTENVKLRLLRVLAMYRIPQPDAEGLLQQAQADFIEVSKTRELRDPEAWLVGTLKRRCLMYWREQSQAQCTSDGHCP